MLALCNPRSGAKQLHRAGKFNCSLFRNALDVQTFNKKNDVIPDRAWVSACKKGGRFRSTQIISV